LQNYINLFTNDKFSYPCATVFFFLLAMPASVVVAIFGSLIFQNAHRPLAPYSIAHYRSRSCLQQFGWILDPVEALNASPEAGGMQVPLVGDPDWAKPSLVLSLLDVGSGYHLSGGIAGNPTRLLWAPWLMV
jgi:hypothetical protein